MERTKKQKLKFEKFRVLAEELLALANWLIENDKHETISFIDLELIILNLFGEFMSSSDT